MLISTENSRSTTADTQLACTLAAVAGALNTAAFEIVGFFSANMTGNISSLSDYLAKANLHPAVFCVYCIHFHCWLLILNSHYKCRAQEKYKCDLRI